MLCLCVRDFRCTAHWLAGPAVPGIWAFWVCEVAARCVPGRGGGDRDRSEEEAEGVGTLWQERRVGTGDW
jgi:hypothetical protein